MAVEVPESVRKKINDLVQIEAKRELPIKWVKLNNLHITLKFLGEIDEEKKSEILPVLKEIGNKHKSFQLQLSGIGCFPNPRNPRVLWVGVEQGNDALCAMSADVEEALAHFGFKREERFHPHVTIGRIKRFCKVDHILEKNIIAEPFEVSAIVLFRSVLKPEGPIYTALAHFPLS